MKTLIFIHGGESFSTELEYLEWIQTVAVEWNIEPFALGEEKKKWKNSIAEKFVGNGDKVYMPNFPNPQNAKYQEWKLFFNAWIEKIALSDEVIFVGTSLGGNFLLKYFSEVSNLLVTHEDEIIQFSEKGENGLLRASQGRRFQIHLVAACQECGDFTTPTNYEFLQELGNRVHIWHAEDDNVVPFSVGKELAEILLEAQTHFFTSEKGYRHFYGIEQFPEFESLLIKNPR